MKLPKNGKSVTVYWWDAFSYLNKNTRYYINETHGKWNGIYEAKYNGNKTMYADIVQESTKSDGTESPADDQEGCRVPLILIVKVVEHRK